MRSIAGTAAKPGVLVNRDFALLWLGHTLSVLGDFLFETTLVVWIASDLAQGQAWASLAVSGLLVASAVPTFVIGPVAGVFVDGAAILGVLLGGALYGTALREFRAHVLGVQFGPLDTIFMGVGLLCVFAGLYARATLRGQVSDENGDRA
ncbi:MAG: hypothetical protein M3Q71_17625 [Chloroflexota bacterium]|nr:hypothetical protein [Chloroflexota bacterium]